MPEDQTVELVRPVSHRGQAVVAHTLNPALRRQRQMNLYEFKAILGYTRLSQSRRETEPNGGDSHL